MKKNTDWYKPRGYLHVDSKLGPNDRQSIFKRIRNPKYIARHAFLPLLYKTISTRRFKKIGINEKGLPIYSHSKDGESTKKVRPIHFASHLDAHIYAYYSQIILAPAYEKMLESTAGLNDCISAYRKIVAPNGEGNKCNIHFAKDAFKEIERRGECVAIAMDIESFFSTLDHKILLKRWAAVLGAERLPVDHYNIFKSITNFKYININELRISQKVGFDEKSIVSYRKYGVQSFFLSMADFRERLGRKEFRVRRNQFKKRLKCGKKVLIGIPQGLPISAMLANIYMYQFDLTIYNELTVKRGIFYRRYSDDIVIVCDYSEWESVHNFIKKVITGNEVALTISENKTEISHFKQYYENNISRFQVWRIDAKTGVEKFNVPFKYLGFEYYGYQTLIKSNNLSAFYRRMKQAVRHKSHIAEKVMEKNCDELKILYKSILYRLFSYKGIKKRNLPDIKKKVLVKNYLEHWVEDTISVKKRYRGNALTYAYKAAKIMDAKEIRKQFRNHFKILQKTIIIHKFDNS